MKSTAEEIARTLNARKYGKGWIAKCPAHDDRKPSLSIGTGRDGRVLVHCFSGCSQEQIINELKRRGIWGSNHVR